MGRTSDAREKILSAAQSLIELRGYSALGVAEICKAADVPKGSFYYFFESKETLALAVIDEHWAEQERTWKGILTGPAEPLQRLRQLFEATEAAQLVGQQSCGTVSGCLFGNLTLEMSNHTEAVRKRLQEIFEAQVDLVAPVIAEALARRRSPSPTPGKPPGRSWRSWRARCCSPSSTTTRTCSARCGRTAWRCSAPMLRAGPWPAEITPRPPTFCLVAGPARRRCGATPT